jgi:transcriptional regulator with XRE-family HTH domain
MFAPGPALRRLRRLRDMKQAHAAELLGVSQATVSRWERGLQAPGEAELVRLRRLLAGEAQPFADQALKRLVETSPEPLHLIRDADHALLCASSARRRRWRVDVDALVGRSLWPFASAAIAAMEARLPELGWGEPEAPAVAFATGANAGGAVPIAPGLVLWERLRLADGAEARLVSTVASVPAHARLIAA